MALVIIKIAPELMQIGMSTMNWENQSNNQFNSITSRNCVTGSWTPKGYQCKADSGASRNPKSASEGF